MFKDIGAIEVLQSLSSCDILHVLLSPQKPFLVTNYNF